jgi:hypothetical protein
VGFDLPGMRPAAAQAAEEAVLIINNPLFILFSAFCSCFLSMNKTHFCSADRNTYSTARGEVLSDSRIKSKARSAGRSLVVEYSLPCQRPWAQSLAPNKERKES